jgi:hypothetical protein
MRDDKNIKTNNYKKQKRSILYLLRKMTSPQPLPQEGGANSLYSKLFPLLSWEKRAERYEIALWAILAKEPDCRDGGDEANKQGEADIEERPKSSRKKQKCYIDRKGFAKKAKK